MLGLTANDYQTFRAQKVFGSLDGLRCFSIIAVIWQHARTGNSVWRPLTLGFLGVDLFFVISGFLIVSLLLRERSATGHISLKKFYIRRVLRIFPLYYGVILCTAAFYATIGHHSAYGRRFLHDLPYYFTFTANFVPVAFTIVWSLATEEQFYLLWPSAEKYLPRHALPVLGALVLVNQFVNLSSGKQLISNVVGSTEWTHLEIFQTTFTPILLGVFAAHLLHSERGYRFVRYLNCGGWGSAICLIALAALLTIMPTDIAGAPRLAAQVAMTALLISCVYQEDHVLQPVLRFPPIRRIGQISYGMYLFHLSVVAFGAQFLWPKYADRSFTSFLAVLLITTLAAEVSFRFFESPILRFKRKYSVVHQTHS